MLPSRWRAWFTPPPRSQSVASEQPLRSEIFSLEQLARHAKTLAGQHQVVTQPRSNRLLQRLDTNEATLRAFNQSSLIVS